MIDSEQTSATELLAPLRGESSNQLLEPLEEWNAYLKRYSDGTGRAPQYEAALGHCKPLRRPRALYDNIEALPAFREWARTHGLPVYRRWGFWHDDVTPRVVDLPVPQLEPDEPKQMTATIRRGTGYEQRTVTNF